MTVLKRYRNMTTFTTFATTCDRPEFISFETSFKVASFPICV